MVVYELGGVDEILGDLLRYEEVLGAVAISREGLIVGSVGLDGEDADIAGAIGAPLVGVADLTARRLGAGGAGGLAIEATGGTIHVRFEGDFAVLVFSERCDLTLAGEACEAAVQRIGGLFAAA